MRKSVVGSPNLSSYNNINRKAQTPPNLGRTGEPIVLDVYEFRKYILQYYKRILDPYKRAYEIRDIMNFMGLVTFTIHLTTV